MKKLITLCLLAISFCVNAQPHGHHHHDHGWGWAAPLMIGGAVAYGVSQPQRQPPIVVVPLNPYSTTSTAGTVWRQDFRYDQGCNCYRQVLIQIQ
jgi:hypothetical protein